MNSNIADCKEDDYENDPMDESSMVVALEDGLKIAGVCMLNITPEQAAYYAKNYNKLKGEGFIQQEDGSALLIHNDVEISMTKREVLSTISLIMARYLEEE